MKRIRVLLGIGDINAGFETDNFAYYDGKNTTEYAIIYGNSGTPWYFTNTSDYKQFELYEPVLENVDPKLPPAEIKWVPNQEVPSLRSLLGQDVKTLNIEFK